MQQCLPISEKLTKKLITNRWSCASIDWKIDNMYKSTHSSMSQEYARREFSLITGTKKKNKTHFKNK